MAEIITSGACQLIEIVRAGEHRELNIGEYRSRQSTAEDQQREAEDHHDPSDGLKSKYKSLFPLIDRDDVCFTDRHFFFLIQQLSQKYIQYDTYDRDQDDDSERQHSGQPACGEDRIRLHLMIQYVGVCVRTIGECQSVSGVVEIKSSDIAAFIGRYRFLRTIGKCDRDPGVR